MDGFAPASSPALPPVVGAVPAMPAFGQPGVNQQSRPVGRPLNDQDADRAKVEKNQEVKRVEDVLPKQLDSKILIFRSSNRGRVLPGAKPIMRILVSELEEAKKQGKSTDDVVSDRLSERFTEGNFQCRFVDRSGKSVINNGQPIPPWDVLLGEEEDPNDDELDENGDPVYEDEAPSSNPAPQQYAYPPAPPAPPMDLATVSSALRAERTEESRRAGDMTSTIMQLQQGQTQMLMQMRADADRQRQEDRREAAEREERESKRRSETRATMLGLVPLAMPFIERIFGPKKEETKAMDPVLAVILEMVKGKSTDSDMLKQTSAIMGEMVSSQMKLQSAGAQAAVQMQAEASGMVFKNMMGTMKEMMEQTSGMKKESEPGMLGQIAEIAKHVIPAIQQNMQQEQAAIPGAPGLPAPAAAPQPAPAAVARKPKTPPPAPATAVEDDPEFAKFPDNKRIFSALETIRKMSIGEVVPEKRLDALRYIIRVMPPAMRDVVKKGDRNAVFAMGTTAVISNKKLLDWIAKEPYQKFLEGTIADAQAILTGTATAASIEESTAASKAFIAHMAAQAVPAAPLADGEAVATGAPVGAPDDHTEVATGDVVKQAEIVQGPGSAVTKRKEKIPPPDAPKV